MGSVTSTLLLRMIDGVSAVAPKVERSIRRVDTAAKRAHRSSTHLSGPNSAIARNLLGISAGLTAKDAVVDYAALERRMTRVAITADASRAAQEAALRSVQATAQETALPLDDVISGVEALVAQGKGLNEAMAFLPSVARTAQASGAAVSDVANSAGALADQLGILPEKMQGAFDVLVAGGKAGKFELKDMAQYLPSLAAQAAAVGLKGEAGLQKLVAMLQVVRNQTGTSSEAATALQNVFAKMETEETAKKFAKFGINLRKEMAKARKEGKPLLDTFIELADRALKGDLSKLPQLFTDQEVATGMRALLSQRGALADLLKMLGSVDGASLGDFNRTLEDTQASIDRLKNSWMGFTNSLGRVADTAGVDGLLTKLSSAMSDVADAANNEAAKGLIDKPTPPATSYREAEDRSMAKLNESATQKEVRWIADFLRGARDQATEWSGADESPQAEVDRLKARRERNRRINPSILHGAQDAYDEAFLEPRITALEKRLALDAAPHDAAGRKIVRTEREAKGNRVVPGAGFMPDEIWAQNAPANQFTRQASRAVPNTPGAFSAPDLTAPKIDAQDLTEAGRRTGETFRVGLQGELDAAVAAARAAGQQIQSALSVTANVKVNMPSISRGLGEQAQSRLDASMSDHGAR